MPRRGKSCRAHQNAVKSYDFTVFLYKIVQIICFYCVAQPDRAFWGDSSDLQAALHDLAGGFFVLVECVCVNIERGRWLAVAEKSCDRADIRAAGDEQACRRVAQTVDVQVGRKIVCFQDFLEAPCEGRRRHWQFHALSAEYIVVFRLLAPVITLGFRLAEGFVFAEQALHFGGEVHIPITGFGFRCFHNNLVTGCFDGIAADVDVLSGKLETICLKLLLYARFVLYHRNRQ